MEALQQISSLPQLTDLLESSYDFWAGLNAQYFHALFIGHALYCCLSDLPGFKRTWLVHLLLTYLWGNGGGVVTTALIMDPKVATFSFFNDYIVSAWVVCWWLVNWFPGGLPANVLNIWWIKMFAKACTMFLRGKLIIDRVNIGVQLHPGTFAAPLILGTIAGCGGRLLADGIMTGWQSMPGLAELSSPGFVSRSAAFAAVCYYTLAYATDLLPVKAAAGLVLTGLMLHTFAADLTGQALDFTAPVTHLLHVVTRVPTPPPQPQPAPVTVLSKRVAPQQRGQATAAAAKSPAKSTTPARPQAKSPTQPTSPPAARTAAAGSKQRAGAAAAAAAGDASDGDAGDAAADVGAQGARQSKARHSTAAASAAEAGSSGVTTRRRAAAVAAYA